MKAGMAIWLDWPLPDCVDEAIAAEASGFSEVWLPDHYFLRDVYAAQALIAERTSRLRLGTAVVSPLLRHPALLASSVATINDLSAGRAIMGVGVGGFEFQTQLGMKVEGPLTVAREAVQIIRSLLAGETNFRGRIFTAEGAKLTWNAGDGVPVYMAARGPKMLELAGEIADGVITHGLTPSYIEFCLEKIRVGAERANRLPDACRLILMLEIEMNENIQAAIDRLRPRCTIMAGGEYSEGLIPVFGLNRDEVMQLRAAVRSSEPKAGAMVTDEMVNTFAVGGPLQLVTERLHQLSEGGVGGVILVFRGDTAKDQVAKIDEVGKAIAEVTE